jgi:hypothetical protein
VLEYKIQFEKLVYYIKLFDKAVSDTFLVTQFMLGLKHELKLVVETQSPKTVSMAAQLSLKQTSSLGEEECMSKNSSATHHEGEPRITRGCGRPSS